MHFSTCVCVNEDVNEAVGLTPPPARPRVLRPCDVRGACLLSRVSGHTPGSRRSPLGHTGTRSRLYTTDERSRGVTSESPVPERAP
jgi:hypothetical protein